MNNNTKAKFKRLGGARSAKDKRPCVGMTSACQPQHNPNKHKQWNFRGPFGK